MNNNVLNFDKRKENLLEDFIFNFVIIL